MKVLCVIFALALALSFHTMAAQPNMNPGLWEYTTVTRIVDGPAFPPQEDTTTECLTEQDVVSGDAFLDDAEDCRITRQDLTASQLDIALTCPGQDGAILDMTMNMNFNGDRADGVIRTQAKTDFGAMEIEVIMEGKRLGDCP